MSLIEIRPPKSVEEYHEACAMVERVYREAGYVSTTLPFEHPTAIILAAKGSSIVGSIGLQSADQDVLPTEQAFEFSADEICSFPRHQIFEALRLAVVDRAEVIPLQALLLAVIHYAGGSHDCNAWVMTLKPTLAKALRRFCHLGTDAMSLQVRPEAINFHPGYWEIAPLPRAIRISRSQTDAAYAHLSVELEGKVHLNLSTFDHHLDYSCADTYHHRNLVGSIAC